MTGKEVSLIILPEWLQDNNTWLLVVALLLLLWLWLLIRRREEDSLSPIRPTPMSADELGRIVFMAARSRDLSRYRGLYLNGPEARTELGVHADSYLDQRSYTVLQHSLDELTRQIPATAIYNGVGEHRGRMFFIRVKFINNQVNIIKVGTHTRLGPVWRLLEPASAPKP